MAKETAQTPTEKATAVRAVTLPMQGIIRKEAAKVEKELKGFYCSWVLKSLNLVK